MGKRRRNRSIRSMGSRAFASEGRRVGRSSLRRRVASRTLRFEPLEQRQLLAVGPQLIGINPNTGEVLEEGEIRHLAPTELTFRFNENEVIDPTTLNGIQVRRSGLDGVFGNFNDVIITPCYVGIGEQSNEVIVRFAETLPDDRYRITIFGTGSTPLRNEAGEAFNGGVNQSLTFELDLGAQIVAVVPQPTGRDANGNLTQARDQIVVYFNNDDLYSTAVTTGQLATNPTVVDPRFYELIFTSDTVENTDDVVFNPIQVSYDPATDSAVLTFAGDLAELSTGAGTYRLRIGTDEELPAVSMPVVPDVLEDVGSSFDTAYDLGLLGAQSQIVQGYIEGESYAIEFLGSGEEPGHRDIDVEDHVAYGSGDSAAGISVIYYNFQSRYGTDPQGHQLYNQITSAQKELARQIFDLFSAYMGVQFIESDIYGVTIVTGDMRAIDIDVDTGPGGVASISSSTMLIMDQAEDWDGEFGGRWFVTAFHGIGYILGLSDAYELVPWSVMGDPDVNAASGAELIVLGDADIVHGTYMFRPEGNDIDLYRFTVDEEGVFTAETFAERLGSTTSLLDTVISLYKDLGGQYELVARNDDYFSEDSFLEMALTPGDYVIGISASGNREFDPTVEDTGLYGLSEGWYDLRLNFRPIEESVIVDATGTELDGDADGTPGGTYNYWLSVRTAENTLFVDKAAVGGSAADGSLARPYRTLVAALAAAQDGDVVRVVGNGGADGKLSTVADNLPYLVGYDSLGRVLEDGANVTVQKGVTLMIDAGAVFKLRKGAVIVDCSAVGNDASGSALQVLGIPGLPVLFTSYNDEGIGLDTNPAVLQIPVAGDWGGILFRTDLDSPVADRTDYEAKGIFLNYVNHADIRYGGGQITVNSRQQVVSPIEMIDSRPTISYNAISRSADAAMSATPDSFEETTFHAPEYQTVFFTCDYDRVGPDIHGNTLIGNSINGLFIRIRTPAGSTLQPLTVSARFDDTDIVHVLKENLIIDGTPGGFIYDSKTGQYVARLDARLTIDPGMVVKLGSAFIDVNFGSQLIAEGVNGHPVVLTSLADDTYGAGGTSDTTNNGANSSPAPGDWGGIYFGHTSTGSLDYATLRYGGGVTRLEGGFAAFNVIEIQQADVRITNSILEYNAAGTGGQAPSNRYGHLDHEAATIFVRGAQPVIVGNTIRNNAAPAISINVNSLNGFLRTDFGRSTGSVDLVEGYDDNYGPLIRENCLENNPINGLLIRGATLTTESVWDDADIVHVLLDEVIIPNLHTYGGLRLVSSPDESLVVKLMGNQAGITAGGDPTDIDDRIGGMLYLIGQPGSPVVITSLADDSVGAGCLSDGTTNGDTNNDGSASVPAPGDWRSILLTEYSHDRNVAVHTEWESAQLTAPGNNATPDKAEYLGTLAPCETSSDDVRRLGYTVYGRLAEPGDVDVYSFEAVAGTEIWIDIDRTSQSLDTVIELIDGNGNVLARSDNSLDEAADPSLLVGGALLMQKLPPWGGQDFFSLNTKDAGMRVILPGAEGSSSVYYVRVRSSSDDLTELSGGLTSGVYQLQIRLHETDEFAGSNIRYADIRYATNGIEIYGQPIHSPLLGEAAEGDATNDTQADAQNIGNLLTSDRAAISVAGILSSLADVDFYQFEVNYEDRRSDINLSPYVGTIFDIDYSDGLARGDITLSVFDSQGRLVFVARESGVMDDQTTSAADLSAGSFGTLDAFLGTAELYQGTYYVAVSSAARMAQQLDQFTVADATNPLVRIEPIDSMIRIAEDHINTTTYTTASPPIVEVLLDETGVVPYHLGDIVLYISQDTDDGRNPNQSRLVAVDPFTGTAEVTYGAYGYDVGDLVISGGNLYALSLDVEDGDPHDDTSGVFVRISPEDGGATEVGDDGIITYELSDEDPPEGEPREVVERDTGIHFEAMAFGNNVLLAIGYRGDQYSEGDPHQSRGVTYVENILYTFDSGNGSVQNIPRNPDDRERADGAGTNAVERGQLFTNLALIAAPGSELTDGMTFTIDGVVFEFDLQGDENNPPGLNDLDAIAVPYAAADGVEIVAAAMQNAINGALADVLATAYGGTVDLARVVDPEIDPPPAVVPIDVQAANPLQVAGEPGPGGRITGAAYLGGTLYVVSETGGLWRVDGPTSTNATAVYIQSSAADLLGIRFAGLTVGPGTVEGGIYGDLLFGISEEGTLYAFNTDGVLQPIFLDGATSVETGVTSVQGLAFSGVQENLWHITSLDGNSYEHGITPSQTRRYTSGVQGGSSFLFGAESQNASSYNVSGETHGVLISNPFDLSEYTVDDVPVLYFTYRAVTEGATYSPTGNGQDMMDAFRVYVTEGDSGQWHLLATNDSFQSTSYTDEYDYYSYTGANLAVAVEVQELFDYTDNASWRQVRIPLSAFAGLSDLRLRFEFTTAGSYNLGDITTTGSELRVLPGADLRDGDTVTFSTEITTEDPDLGEVITTVTTIFEFDSGRTLILPGGTALNEGDTISITGPDTRAYLEFDADGEVGSALFVSSGASFADGQTFSVTDGTDTALFEFDSGYTIYVPVTGGAAIDHYDSIVIDDNAGSGNIVFQFAKDGPILGDHVINITDETTQDELADLIVSAIGDAGLGLTPVYLGDGVIHVGGENQLLYLGYAPGLTLMGAPGVQSGAIAILFDPTTDPTASDMAALIAESINDSGLNVTASTSDFELFLDGEGAALTIETAPLYRVTNTAINIVPSDSAGDVATRVMDAIVGIVDLGVTPWMQGNRVNLAGAVNASVTQGASIGIEGEPGVAVVGNVPVRIHEGMTAAEVGDALADAMAASFAGFGVQITAPEGSALIPGDTITVGKGADLLVLEIGEGFNDLTAEEVAVALADVLSENGFEVTVDGRRIKVMGDDITVDVTGTAFTAIDSSITVKRYGGVINVIGHTVVDPGKLLLAEELYGDQFGNFNSAARSQSNGYSGIYVDDLIIGFAKRGEEVTKANADAAFVADPSLPDWQILEGSYQLEIRRGTEYITYTGYVDTNSYSIGLDRSFYPSDRLTEGASLIAVSGAEISNGMSFTLGDGNNEVTFIFEDTGALAVSETGNTMSSAFATGLIPGTVDGYAATTEIGNVSDVDFFSLNLAAGDFLTIDIDAYAIGSSLDSVVRLFNASGVELARSDDSVTEEGYFDLDSYIEFTAPEDGVYYVGVSSYYNVAYDPFVASSNSGYSTGKYEIYFGLNGGDAGIVGLDPGAEVDVEAGVILPYGAAYTAAQIAQLIVSAINLDVVQAVLDIRASCNPNGTRVFLDGSVTLITGFAGVALREPDDTLAQATDSGIAPDGALSFRGSGVIGDSHGGDDYGWDVDMIMMQLSAGDTVSIDVSAYDQDGSSPYAIIQLFDASGLSLDYSYYTLSDDGTYTYDPYLEYTVAEDGIYYVGVSGYSNISYDPFVADSGVSGTTGAYTIDIARGGTTVHSLGCTIYDFMGDENRDRDQGQLIIESNVITYSAGWGILVDDVLDTDSDSPHQGPVRYFGVTNTAELAPGVTIVNNVLANNGDGGIRFSGDAAAAVTYGRIVNNTIYGTGAGDVGIQIDDNASPTVLNNILAHLTTGLNVDTTSRTTVLGGLLFQGNGTNSNAGLGEQAIVLAAADPLFVDAVAGNFYLAAGSRAIDSAIRSMVDRNEMTSVREPLGIDAAPVLAPEYDAFASFRVDDPSVASPLGLGETVFIDRGAIDRADFEGPTIRLVTPADGDGDTFVQSNRGLAEFILQIDDGGTGVDSSTVVGGNLVVQKDGVTLVQGVNYTFRYDETNKQIRLAAGSGVWQGGVYSIYVNNTAATGIKDLADNSLQANQTSGIVAFTVQVGGGADFGDAPATYPAGASHTIVPGFFLGYDVDADAGAEPSAAASADAYDDGVVFNSTLYLTGQAEITVRASAAGFLDAWIDYNRNGTWEAGEKVLSSKPLVEGVNTLTFSVPAGATPVAGTTFARFRFSSTGGLSPDGAAANGEVEDYRVQLLTAPWQNPNNCYDVSGDGVLSSRDALLLSNFLYFNGPRATPEGPGTAPFPAAPAPYYDVNGDSYVSAQDALLLVTALRNAPAPEGEGAATVSASLLATDDTAIASSTIAGNAEGEGADLAGALFVADSFSADSLAAGSTGYRVLQALAYEDTVLTSMTSGRADGIGRRDWGADAVAIGDSGAAGSAERRVDRSARQTASVVDRIMAWDAFADELTFARAIDSVGDDPFASTARRSDTMDAVFAEFDDLVVVAVGEED